MRRKIITAISLFFVLTLLFTAQFSHVAQAHEVDYHHPLTNPVTSPVTSPVTCPITGPAQLFTISGNVTNRFWYLFKHGMNRIAPAVGVKVKAVALFTFKNVTVTTTTDANGNYTLKPGKPGWYNVSVSDGKAKVYTPIFEIVNDNKPAGKHHVNFQGEIVNFR